MIKKYIFPAAILLIAHGTVFTMMNSRKIMNGTSRLTLNKNNCNVRALHDLGFDGTVAPLNNISRDELKALEIKLKEREKHYAWQIANEVAKIRAKSAILAAKLPHDQEQRMFQEADKIVIKKE